MRFLPNEVVYAALIGAFSSTALALWAWLRGRRKDKVETEAIRRTTFSAIYDDASDLSRYVREQVDEAVKEAVADIKKEMDELKIRSDKIFEEFRKFYTKLWIWEQNKRQGPMPVVEKSLLIELNLTHLSDLKFGDEDPQSSESVV